MLYRTVARCRQLAQKQRALACGVALDPESATDALRQLVFLRLQKELSNKFAMIIYVSFVLQNANNAGL